MVDHGVRHVRVPLPDRKKHDLQINNKKNSSNNNNDNSNHHSNTNKE